MNLDRIAELRPIIWKYFIKRWLSLAGWIAAYSLAGALLGAVYYFARRP